MTIKMVLVVQILEGREGMQTMRAGEGCFTSALVSAAFA
jgi:hypothetical protein